MRETGDMDCHPNCEEHGKSPCQGIGCDGLDADERATRTPAVFTDEEYLDLRRQAYNVLTQHSSDVTRADAVVRLIEQTLAEREAPAAQSTGAAGRYLDTLEDMDPSPRLQQAVDATRADRTEADAAAEKREVAIGRLMTMVNESTPERRRNHAEWVLDAILDAANAAS